MTNPCSEIIFGGKKVCMMGLKYYILNNDMEVIEADLKGWAEFFGTNERIIAKNSKTINGFEYSVSTVFIGIENEIFETMILSDDMDEEYQERCGTYEGAREMHIIACEWVMKQHDK